MNKLLRKISALVAIIISACCFMLNGCNEYSVINGVTAFNTDVYILADGKAMPQTTKTEILSLLENLDAEFSLADEFNDTSFTAKFNQSADGLAFDGYPNAKAVLDECKRVYALTPKFNPAVAPILDLWKLSSSTFIKGDANFLPPTADLINASLLNADFNSVTVSEDKAIKSNPALKIDLGGVVKGYATEKIKDILQANGYTDGYVSIGGSSLYILSSAEDLGVKHPRKDDLIIKVNKAQVKNQAVSTSGDYVRFHEYSGQRYCHILDGQTGKPTQSGFNSVTVIGKNGCFVDAISTALACMERQEFISFSKANLADYSVFGVFDFGGEKQILTNKKQGEHFTLLDKEYTVVNF